MKTYIVKRNLKLMILLTITGICCLGFSQWKTLKSLTFPNASSSLSSELLDWEKIKESELQGIAKMPSLGFRNIFSNFIFLDFLQYFGDDSAREKGGYGLTDNYFESIIANDPYYRKFYLFLSGSGTVYAAQPKESVRLMEKGLSSLSPNTPSDSYYVWRYKGVDELLFLADGRAAQKSFSTAAAWAEESQHSDSDMFERLSMKTAQYLSANPQSEAAQVAAWSSVLTTALDNATRERAVAQIESLGGHVIFSDDGGIKIEFAQKTNSQNSDS